MKKATLSLGRGLLLLLPFAAVAADYAAIKSRVTPIEVTPRVFYVQGKPGIASAENEGYNSNAGFVVTDDGVVVIDALGTPPLGQALVEAIRGVTRKPVRRVIVTHYHADHFYGLEPLKRAGAEVWAHERAKDYLDSGEAQRRLEQRSRDLFPWVDEKTKIVRADRWLEKIGQLLRLKSRLMVTGHGAVSRDPARDLTLTRDYLLFLREAMGKAVEDFVPFEEAYAATDWSRFAKVPAFDAANRINAYGQYLVMERELLKK
jgi:glyoxylase-like metal-dependent hydrolase (beta-lactamase superfamily II)